MSAAYLAFDLGASSGRAMLGSLDANDRLTLQEIHRFPHGMIDTLGSLHWDILGLYREMLHSLVACRKTQLDPPACIGIDTWGVDFGLLDRNGKLLGNPRTYRDPANAGAMEAFFEKIPGRVVYQRTGIQLLPINTLYQLHARVREDDPQLRAAEDLLFLPDLLSYFLTGEKFSEFTFATTSQLLDARSSDWDPLLFEALGISTSLMQELVPPGTTVARLIPSVADHTGLGAVPVVAVATHDTASAVAAVPTLDEDFAYISSGTWSLVGIEAKSPIIDERTRERNITNEGGVEGRTRVLKNVMGLWLLEECRRSWRRERRRSYQELLSLAELSRPLRTLIDPDDPRFLNPLDMPRAIRDFARETGQPEPEEPGQLVRAIFESLALATRHTLDQLREISVRPLRRLHVIGGGSRSRMLCQLTADATGIPVHAGPAEATAIGNLLIQAMAQGRVASLGELRRIVRESFPVEPFEPVGGSDWEPAYHRFLELRERRSGESS
jgi:rhamnulokinase